MADVNLYKKTSAPATANPNDIIFVKSGSLVSMYICDTEGTPYGVIPSGDYVSKVNNATGSVQLDLSFSGGVLALTGSSATQNLDARYFKNTDNLPFTQISGLPTTVAGYYITDAYTKTQVDAITGALPNLQTTTQTNLVAAINELVTAINNGMRTPQPIDCSANPNYPASQSGDTYKVTVAGKIGGASGQVVQVNDQVICTATNGGGDQATVGASFFIIQGNVDSATTAVQGLGRIATQAEVNTGTEDKAWVTPVTLATLLDANYYTAAEVNAKGYLTAEADTLQSVTNRGNTTSASISAGAGGSSSVTIGSSGGIYLDLGTVTGGWARNLNVQSNNSDASKKIGASFGLFGTNQALTYSYWSIDGTDITGSYGSLNSLRLYPDGSLYYGAPPANASAATKFLGLSSDGHTISTRTAAQVLSDISALANTTSGPDWNSPATTTRAQFMSGSTNQPGGGTTNWGGIYMPLSTNYGSEIALRLNRGFIRTLENGTWGDWVEMITSGNLAASETDPVWTLAKAAATTISGNWNFTGNPIFSEGFNINMNPAAGGGFTIGSGSYTNFIGGAYGHIANTVISSNAYQPTHNTDLWSQHYNSGSSLLELTQAGALKIYTAAAGSSDGTFATFWGTGKTVATTDLLSSYLPLAGGTMTGALGIKDGVGINDSNEQYTLFTRDTAHGWTMLQYNALLSGGNWSQPAAGAASTAIVATNNGGWIYTAAAGSTSGGLDTYWATKQKIATQDWVATQIPAVPTLQQVTDAGSTTTDNINVGNALSINGAAGSYREVMFRTGSSYRWGIITNSNAESGGNTGSDFGIYRYDDSGNALGNALSINRSTGNISIASNITAAKFAKSGGTSSQFLKADGSVDSNTYLTSFTESDPIFTASAAADIEASDISNWNDAYAASHAALTLGTTKSGLSLIGQVLSLALATTSADGAMSKADKTKLDGIATGANNYSLPIASGSILGGIKVGSGLSIDANGVLTNNNGTAYTLPVATSTVLGGIKIGATLNIASGVLNGNKATNVALGMVMAGDNMAVDANGAITMQWAQVDW